MGNEALSSLLHTGMIERRGCHIRARSFFGEGAQKRRPILVFRSQEIHFPVGTKRNRRSSVQCLQPSNGRCILNRGTRARNRNIRAYDSRHNNRSGRPGDERSAESRISLAQTMRLSRAGRSPPLAIFWRWLVMAHASICNSHYRRRGSNPHSLA